MSSLLSGPYALLIKIALVLGLFGGLYGVYKYSVNQAVTVAVQETEKKHITELALQRVKLSDRAYEEQDKLRKQLELNKKVKDEDIKRLDAKYSTLLASLSDRPTRATGTSSESTPTEAGTSPTGAYPSQLYREDANAFVDFSRDAEIVRLSLIQCYKDYETAKEAIDKFLDSR
jgi:hypothetical protein